MPGLTLIGSPRERAGAISFVLDEWRVEDVGVALNRKGIAVRAGHHCAQPILRRFGDETTVRPSFALYSPPRTSMRSLRRCTVWLPIAGANAASDRHGWGFNEKWRQPCRQELESMLSS